MKERKRVTVSFEKPTRTKQSFKNDCDINVVVNHYQRHGIINHVARGSGVYGDFSTVEDYQSSLNRVMNAQEMFGALPSKIRSRFANDPAELIGFLENPANLDEAVELGLVVRPRTENSSAGTELSGVSEPAG